MFACVVWLLSIPLWAYVAYSLNASEKNKRKALFVVLAIQFCLIGGLRDYNTFNDSKTYSSHFNRVNDEGAFYKVHKQRMETGFLVFEKFVHKHISHDYPVLFIITSVFCIGTTMYFFYKQSRCFWLTVFMFVAMRTYFVQIQAMRQSIATAILLVSFLCLEKRKITVALLLGLLATTFHSTAIVGFFLFALSFFSLSKKNIALYCIASFTCLFFMATLLSLFGHGDSSYLGDDNMKFGNVIGLTFYSILLLFSWKIGKSIMEENKLMVWGTLLCIFCSIIALIITAFNRAAEYFSPFAFILFANALQNTPPNKKRYYTIFACIAVFVMYIGVLTLKPGWNKAYPYYFFWERSNNRSLTYINNKTDENSNTLHLHWQVQPVL